MASTPVEPSQDSGHRPDHSILSLLFHLSRHLGIALEHRVAPFDVTAQQAALLVHSCSAHSINPTQLASRLGTDNAGITRLVDRVEARGLAVRESSPGDRRIIIIKATDAGQALVPQLLAEFRGANEQLLDGFSAAETETLQALLYRLLKNVKAAEPGESAPVAQGFSPSSTTPPVAQGFSPSPTTTPSEPGGIAIR